MRILIADDAIVIQERLALMLSEIEGVEIIGYARTGNEAVNCVREMRPDLLILDIWMPEGSGLDVLEAVRDEARPPAVIVLTNYTSEQYRKKCTDAGANFFLSKSMEFDRLAEVIGGMKAVT